MTALSKFRRTPAGYAIMSSALFVSILGSPAVANLGTFETPSLQQELLPSGEPQAPAISTTRLTEMLESAVEDLEAYSIDLKAEQTLALRQVNLLKVMDQLIRDIDGLFVGESDELSPVEKVSLARRIVENNVRIARKQASAGQLMSEDLVEISLAEGEQRVVSASFTQLAANRRQMVKAIEETKHDIDYVVDEIARSRDENSYYRQALQQVTDLFEKVLLVPAAGMSDLEENFAALKAWQREYHDELATTDDTVSASLL